MNRDRSSSSKALQLSLLNANYQAGVSGDDCGEETTNPRTTQSNSCERSKLKDAIMESTEDTREQ
jgi:hypothetical protein